MKKGKDSLATRDASRGPAPVHEAEKSKKKRGNLKIDIYIAWCKACGICVAFCPAQVFSKEEDDYPRVVHPEACTGCGWCEIHCPDFAITVHEKKSKE